MFEVSRFEKVFTFQNVLLHETIQSMCDSHVAKEAIMDHLRLKIGGVAIKGDLVAMRYLLRFVANKGVVPAGVKPHIKDTRAGFILMCWDILQKNEYDSDHPLARLARKFVEDYQQHIAMIDIVKKHVDQLADNVFGTVLINHLGKYDLEEAMRGLGIVINNCVVFPCAKRTENFAFITETANKPTGSILIHKNDNIQAVLTMDFS